MSERLTLVLPLRGRLDLTRRWFAWYEACGLQAPVIAVDGSERADAGAAAALIAAGASAGRPWRHVLLPDASFHERVAIGAGEVATPYAAMAANDDFPVLAGLESCVRELDARPELAACGGDNGAYLAASARARATAWSLGGRRDVAGTGPLERMTTLLDAYDPPWYDPHRAETLRASTRVLTASRVSDPHLLELLQGLATAAAGDIARVPDCHLIRQVDAPGSASGALAAERGDLLDEMLAEGWGAQFAAFLDAAQSLAGGEIRAREALRRAYARYARAAVLRATASRSPSLAARAARAVARRVGPRVRAKRRENAAPLETVLRFVARKGASA